MLLRNLFLATIVAAIAGCGPTTPAGGEGSVEITYSFSGVESPTKVAVYLIDGEASGYNCYTLPFTPEHGIVDTARNLPVSGVASFDEIPSGDRWIAYAIGTDAGVQVASACEDNIRIRHDELSGVTLRLLNNPLNSHGRFQSDLELSFGLPSEAVHTLVAFDVACDALDLNDDLCRISSGVAELLLDLDVTAAWNVNQAGHRVQGAMVWEQIEGVPVGPEWKIVTGNFHGEIPGATYMEIQTNDLRVHLDQLVLFMISEVMGLDLKDFEDEAELIVESFTCDMRLVRGSVRAYDNDFDGIADSIAGAMDAEIELPSFGFVHNLELDWTAWRD